jgi:hypothetical protein
MFDMVQVKKAGKPKDSRDNFAIQTIIKDTILDCGDAIDEQLVDR